MTTRRLLLAATFAAAATASGTAGGQAVPPRISDGVRLPSQGLASTDNAAAIFVNPANIALMPGPEVRFTLIHTGDASTIPNKGYAFDAAAPLWILATGLRLDWMQPPDAAPAPFSFDGSPKNYGSVRWANAIRLGSFAAVGTSLAWSNAKTQQLHDHFSVTTGLTVRPNRYLSAAAVFRDWNSPENDVGQKIEPSVDLALAARPVFGRKLLQVGLEASYRSDVERWVPGANLAVDIPYVGTLRGGAQVVDFEEASVVASAGLDVNLDSLQVMGGAVFGSAITRPGTGFYAGAAIRSFRDSPKIPSAGRLVRIRINSTPDIRGHVRMLRQLWKLAKSPEVDGVLLVLRAKPAPSLAHAEELVDALRLFKRNGKKVLCHLEDAGGRALFVCSEADRIAINPAGGLRFSGLASRFFYFGGLLDKLGIRADFVRIGSHKLAPEQFTKGPSAVGEADHRKLLKTIEQVYVDQIGKGRGQPAETVRRRLAKGPFIANEARDAKLVDDLVYEDEIGRFAEEALGHDVRIVDLKTHTSAPQYWRTPPRIAVVYLHGDMVDGKSQRIPIVGLRLAGSRTVGAALKKAREDPTVKAVVLRVETGGGSSLAADVILREAALTAKVKPFVVSMGSRAASGGYYASVAGQQIFANRATMTGSIGIFYGKVDVLGLLGKLGVKTVGYKTAPRADAESLFRPFSDDERRELGVKVKQFYDLFIGRVAQGRKMKPAAVHAVAQGRLWTGEQAQQKGLVDQIGGLRQALAKARELASLPADAPIVELPREASSLLEMALDLVGLARSSSATTAWVPPPVIELARALVPLTIYESYKPLARMELLISEP